MTYDIWVVIHDVLSLHSLDNLSLAKVVRVMTLQQMLLSRRNKEMIEGLCDGRSKGTTLSLRG